MIAILINYRIIITSLPLILPQQLVNINLSRPLTLRFRICLFRAKLLRSRDKLLTPSLARLLQKTATTIRTFRLIT